MARRESWGVRILVAAAALMIFIYCIQWKLVGFRGVSHRPAIVGDHAGRLLTYLREEKIVDNTDGHQGPYHLQYGKIDQSEGQHSSLVKHFKGKKMGTFFEAGANNGEFRSNTLALEAELGWTGILVEPVPFLYEVLVKTNRKAMFLHACVGTKAFPYVGQIRVMENENQLQINNGDRGGASLEGYHQVPGQKIITIPVDCYPLMDILMAAGLTTLDFLSLDLQGPELDVLKSIAWDLVNIKLISVEIDFRVGDKKDALLKNITDYLRPKGYEYVENVQLDYFFVKDN